MNTSQFRVDRRGERGRAYRRTQATAAAARPGWLEIAEAGILYFGVTLMPLLVVILLYQCGVIG